MRLAELCWTNLGKAGLYKAQLEGANISEVPNMQNASFVGAHLTKSNLAGADFKSADLSQANLEGAQLQEANIANHVGHLDESMASKRPQYGTGVAQLSDEGLQQHSRQVPDNTCCQHDTRVATSQG